MSRGSQVSVSLGPGPSEPAFIAIQGNGGAGIGINDGAVTIRRGAVIENNGGAISVTGGFLQTNGGSGDAGNIMRNNGFGVHAGSHATVSLSGNNLLEKERRRRYSGLQRKQSHRQRWPDCRRHAAGHDDRWSPDPRNQCRAGCNGHDHRGPQDSEQWLPVPAAGDCRRHPCGKLVAQPHGAGGGDEE